MQNRKKESPVLDQNSLDIPTVTESEELIAKHAPKAIQVLRESNAMDLLDILGLSAHAESAI